MIEVRHGQLSADFLSPCLQFGAQFPRLLGLVIGTVTRLRGIFAKIEKL